jgi:hypothetical protein
MRWWESTMTVLVLPPMLTNKKNETRAGIAYPARVFSFFGPGDAGLKIIYFAGLQMGV